MPKLQNIKEKKRKKEKTNEQQRHKSMLCNTCIACRFIIKENFVQRSSLESLGFDSTALETITCENREWSVLSLPQKEPGPR